MLSSNDDRSLANETLSGDRLLAAVVHDARWWAACLGLLGLLSAAAMLALPAAIGKAIDEVVAASAASGAGDPVWATARGPLVVAAGLVACLVAVDAASQLVAGAGTARSTGRLRLRLSRHILACGPRVTQRDGEGDLVARLVGSTASTAQAGAVVAGLFAALAVPVGGLVALALIDPWLAVTFGAGMVLVGGTVRAYLRDAHAATTAYLQEQESIATRLVDALAGARTIAAARTTGREVDRVLEPLGRLRRHGFAMWENMARLVLKGEPVVLLTQMAVIGVAGLALSAGRLSAGEMLAASRYSVMAAGIGGVIDELSALTRARAGGQRIAEVLSEPVTTYGRASFFPDSGCLELHGVTAGAGEAAEPPLIDGLDLIVPGGCTVALVGASGAGKSLVAALAGRLRDPIRGEVRLDGVPLDRLDHASLRRAVAYAFERPTLLGASVAESIGFGVQRARPELIREAARAAGADSFIQRLPGGYDAALAANPMSGGERQRLGLARALVSGARVLILDDATSSLDTATEARIAEALTTRMVGRTRLIVTHRAVTAARADLVVWLDHGRVRAVGGHRLLWSDPGYRAIFRPESGEAGPDSLGAGETSSGTARTLALRPDERKDASLEPERVP